MGPRVPQYAVMDRAALRKREGRSEARSYALRLALASDDEHCVGAAQ